MRLKLRSPGLPHYIDGKAGPRQGRICSTVNDPAGSARRSSASFPVSWNRPPRGGGLVRTPKSGRYLPKNVSGDGWTPAWMAFAELRMPFVVSSVPKRSIATSSIITSAAAMPPADHALRSVRAAA